MPGEHRCLACSKIFKTASALKSHSKAKNHTANLFVCDKTMPGEHRCLACSKAFKTASALKSHSEAKNHTANLFVCDKTMPGEHRCLACSKAFKTASALKSHSKAKKHTANLFVCEGCKLTFFTLMALEEHMNSPSHADGHTSAAFMDGQDGSDVHPDTVDSDPYCHLCERQFTDILALNQHLFASPEHGWGFEYPGEVPPETPVSQGHNKNSVTDGRDFKCPFCQRMFKSPSGIALHVESGCHKITRHHVTAAVHAMDIVPNITIKRITGPARPPTVRTYVATEASFNGTAYKCYLCPKSFRTLKSLDGHLNSPAHDDDEFRCPQCKTEFKLISGFVQHLESRSCGLAKTTQIHSYFNDLTGQFSRLLKL